MPSERSLKILHTPWLVLSVSLLVPSHLILDPCPPLLTINAFSCSNHLPQISLLLPPQTITSIVALAISASLVDYYNNNGYPAIDGDYKPRIRIVLVASVWMAFFSSESRASI
jgi:hypothetical protein